MFLMHTSKEIKNTLNYGLNVIIVNLKLQEGCKYKIGGGGELDFFLE